MEREGYCMRLTIFLIILLLATSTVSEAAPWNVTFQITNLPEVGSPPPPPSTYVRVIGVHSNASDGFDRDYDVIAPPPPFTDALDAYFPSSHEVVTRLSKDIRSPGGFNGWELNVKIPSNSQGKIQWDIEEVPAIFDLTLSGNSDIDLRNRKNISLTPGSYTFKIISKKQSAGNVLLATDKISAITEVDKHTNFTISVKNLGRGTIFNAGLTSPSSTVSLQVTPANFMLGDNEVRILSVSVNSSNSGSVPVKLKITNSTFQKNASLELFILALDPNNRKDSTSQNDSTSSVKDTYLLNNTEVLNGSFVKDSYLVNTTMDAGANANDDSVLIDTIATGSKTNITNSTVSSVTIQNTTVLKSDIVDSVLADSYVINSTISNAMLTNLSKIINVDLSAFTKGSSIELDNVTIEKDASGAKIRSGNGKVVYKSVTFTKIYKEVFLEKLILDSNNATLLPNVPLQIKGDLTGNFSLSVNQSESATLNVAETGINPDGEGYEGKLDLTPRSNYINIESSSSNINEARLKIFFDGESSGISLYYYNKSIKEWEKITGDSTFGIEGGKNYVEVTLQHFSTYMLLSSASSSQQNTPSSGGGGGGGGGGGASGEVYENIEIKEKYDMHIFKDETTSYKFSNSQNPVKSINIIGNVNAGEINVAVEVLRNTSTLVDIPAPGIVYKNMNIWVGTYGFAVPKNIKDAKIEFMVNSEWLDEKSIGDVILYSYSDGVWQPLQTEKIDVVGENVYYRSTTNHFSPFAISGVQKYKDETTVSPDVSAELDSRSKESIDDDVVGILSGILGFALPKGGSTSISFVAIGLIGLILLGLIIVKRRQ